MPSRSVRSPELRATLSLQQEHDDLLDLSLVTGKRIIETRLGRSILIEEGNSAAALEVMIGSAYIRNG